MRKVLLTFSAMLAFIACSNDNMDITSTATPQTTQTDGIKVDIAITRTDNTGSKTKAYAKSDWADNDVVFIFFKDIAAPKYLEMKYNESEDTWVPKFQNGLSSSDLSGAANKQMTAIYLPYASNATVAASETDFVFSDLTYNGYFLQTQQVSYTFDGAVINGELQMQAPALTNGIHVHFDASGYEDGHEYDLYQDYVRPLTLTKVTANGEIIKSEGEKGKAITGFQDGSYLSFSGVLDATAVDATLTYEFSIDDKTSSTLYTRKVVGVTINASSNKIGLNAINNTTKWPNAFEYVDLGLSSGVRWAKHNVGAASVYEYGNMYSWGEPEVHDYMTWDDYFDTDDDGDTFKEYYNGAGGKTVLDPERDAAHVNWNGKWRMPTNEEKQELQSECSFISNFNDGYTGPNTYSSTGVQLTIATKGASPELLFTFGTIRSGSKMLSGFATYWTSSLFADDNQYAISHVEHLADTPGTDGQPADTPRPAMLAVRPVWKP